jgi:glycosyltransferase involved in cell wall biosynthesis
MTTRILVISPQMCRGDSSSGALRLQRMVELLATFAEVDFLTGEPEPGRGHEDHRYWETLRRSGARIVAADYRGRPSLWCAAQARPYDWIIAEFWFEAAEILNSVDTLRRDYPGLRFAIDTVDVHYLRELSVLACGLSVYGTEDEIRRRRSHELRTYRGADLLVTVTGEDAAALRAEEGIPRLVHVPNIVVSLPRATRPRKPALLFIGGFLHQPNVDGVHWFAREVFPLVRSRIPDATFTVVGSHPPPDILALRETPGIDVVGFVADTRPWLDDAAVSVAPLRYGGGMKGKVTEALSGALPVVTTSFGAQGLDAVSGVHLHVADTPEAFADAVTACLGDPDEAARMGRRGQELVEAACGTERVRRDLAAAFAADPIAGVGGPPRSLGRRLSVLVRCQAWLLRCRGSRLKRRLLRTLGRGTPSEGSQTVHT